MAKGRWGAKDVKNTWGSTAPLTSWPGMKGKTDAPQSLSIMWASVWHSPLCVTCGVDLWDLWN